MRWVDRCNSPVRVTPSCQFRNTNSLSSNSHSSVNPLRCWGSRQGLEPCRKISRFSASYVKCNSDAMFTYPSLLHIWRFPFITDRFLVITLLIIGRVSLQASQQVNSCSTLASIVTTHPMSGFFVFLLLRPTIDFENLYNEETWWKWGELNPCPKHLTMCNLQI